MGADMNSSEPIDLLVQEEYPEATIIRIRARALRESEQLDAVRDRLYRLAEGVDGRLILDLSAVESLDSAWLGWLLTLRKRLMQRGRAFQPPCRRRGLFAFFPNDREALEAVRQGEPDPLLLCGVRPEIMELFQIC